MAVIVQVLVRADASGVVFTVNPVTGAREVQVNAIRGLGDRFVSGNATPDQWVVSDRTVCVSRTENALTEEQVNEIAQLARKVESHFGQPQDVEWAIADDKVFLLQVRPITGMAKAASEGGQTTIPIPIVVPEGYWTRRREHFPRPMSPMYASFGPTMMTESLRLAAKDLGLPFETIDFKLIGDSVYARVIPPGGKDRRPPPAWLLRILVRLVPSIRAQTKKMIDTVRTDRLGQYLQKWNGEWKPELIKRDNEHLAVNLPSLSDLELESHLSKTFEHVQWAFELHFRYLALPLLTIGELANTCKDLFAWDNLRVFDLLAGLSEKDSEPSKRLAELASLVQRDPKLGEAITKVNESTRLEEVTSINPEFREKFGAYLKDFGAIALSYEVIDPTLAEMPLELLRLIQAQIVRHYDPETIARALEKKRIAAEADAMRSLGSIGEETKAHFDHRGFSDRGWRGPVPSSNRCTRVWDTSRPNSGKRDVEAERRPEGEGRRKSRDCNSPSLRATTPVS
jgi:pyruvate,water dikinase